MGKKAPGSAAAATPGDAGGVGKACTPVCPLCSCDVTSNEESILGGLRAEAARQREEGPFEAPRPRRPPLVVLPGRRGKRLPQMVAGLPASVPPVIPLTPPPRPPSPAQPPVRRPLHSMPRGVLSQPMPRRGACHRHASRPCPAHAAPPAVLRAGAAPPRPDRRLQGPPSGWRCSATFLRVAPAGDRHAHACSVRRLPPLLCPPQYLERCVRAEYREGGRMRNELTTVLITAQNVGWLLQGTAGVARLWAGCCGASGAPVGPAGVGLNVGAGAQAGRASYCPDYGCTRGRWGGLWVPRHRRPLPGSLAALLRSLPPPPSAARAVQKPQDLIASNGRPQKWKSLRTCPACHGASLTCLAVLMHAARSTCPACHGGCTCVYTSAACVYTCAHARSWTSRSPAARVHTQSTRAWVPVHVRSLVPCQFLHTSLLPPLKLPSPLMHRRGFHRGRGGRQGAQGCRAAAHARATPAPGQGGGGACDPSA